LERHFSQTLDKIMHRMSYGFFAISLALALSSHSPAQEPMASLVTTVQSAANPMQAELVALQGRLATVDATLAHEKKVKSWLIVAVVVGSLLGFALGSLMTWFGMKSSRQLLDRL
jgi:hypothetical protein